MQKSERSRRIEVRPGRPQDPAWWARGVILIVLGALPCGLLGLGAAATLALLVREIEGPIALGGVLALGCLSYLGFRYFRLTTARWIFGGDGVLRIVDNHTAFRRELSLGRIRHLGMPDPHSIEVVIYDAERHAPEFLQLPVRTIHAEDVIDDVESLVEQRFREGEDRHVYSVLQGGDLRCSAPWVLQEVLPLTPRATEARARRFGDSYVEIGGVRHMLRAAPIPHACDAQGRCCVVRRGRVLFSFDGLALARISKMGHAGAASERGLVVIEFSNGEVMCLDQFSGVLLWNDEVVAELDLGETTVAIQAESPLPRSWLLVAVATWVWVRPAYPVDRPSSRTDVGQDPDP